MADADRDRWNAAWREAPARGVSAFLEENAALLPSRGRVLDLAGGPGHDALWLAAKGLDVTLADVSDVALARARAEADARGLPLTTALRDVERLGPPPGPWDVVVCFFYLQRDLFPRWPSLLAQGGLLLFAQPTRTNLERHPKPGSRFLLEPGELATLVPAELEVLSLTEGWTPRDVHEARLVARRR
ncbi:MAG: methyltransferase domain-containing protein [Myxococcota bacterium]